MMRKKRAMAVRFNDNNKPVPDLTNTARDKEMSTATPPPDNFYSTVLAW
jgi:hypothetical protein